SARLQHQQAGRGRLKPGVRQNRVTTALGARRFLGLPLRNATCLLASTPCPSAFNQLWRWGPGRTVSPAKTPSKKQNKMRNPYLKKTGGKDGGSKIGNQTVDNTMTPNQVLMALGRGCAIAGCQVKNCYGKLCLEGTGMCPVCGEKGKCPAVKTGKYNQCGNIAKFGHRMNDAVKSYGYCTRCLAPWRFGTHHTQGKDDDCVIHSRLQRIVLEKKPPRQSLRSLSHL
ncbi:hypothetical protein THAOC_13707, partial [Thalassiosira oceanica]